MTSTDQELLAQRFEDSRSQLTDLAYRMLGSFAEADDAVQEAWIRLSRAGSGVENLGGWLRTVVARVCLDMLRSRKSRREDSLADVSDPVVSPEDESNPEREAVIADSLGLAMVAVLDMLAPSERVAFVLHDLFGVPFDEIAPIVGRTPSAARQLASRGRRRVQGGTSVADADLPRRREVVDAFLNASRNGNFDALLALLDPEVVLKADSGAVKAGASREVVGPKAVAQTFSGRARDARLALVNGLPGAVWAPGGRPRVVFSFTVRDGRIVRIELLASPQRLSQLDLQMLSS